VFESVQVGQKLSKAAYEEELPHLRAELLRVQERLREAEFSVVVVIAGVEGAGKGTTVNTLLEWLDARGIAVHAVGETTPEETERPRFYRFWRRLPPKGEMAVFFGSWYTEPIVEHSLGRSDDDRLEHELRRIAEFEQMLVDENVLVLKYWLHVTKAQQRKSFEKLEADPDTAWRVTKRDWKFHRTYDSFTETSAQALRHTDTAHAPWTLVEARDRRFRHVTVARHLLETLRKRLDATPTEISPREPLPVPPQTNLLNALDLGRSIDRPTYQIRVAKHQGRLGRLARCLTDADRSAVLVFEGPDAAGKGGCIRRIVQVLDARFYRVVPIAAPSDEELARPYLWRFWRRLPRRGEFAIFDRSWYGRVLVERIEGFCEPEACRRAYAEINAFEEQLVEAGTLVFKFWLAISPEEQLRRFEQRENVAYKRYKLTPEDWRNREKWLAYEAAACEMIQKTSTEIAPWTLVEADDKLNARVRVLKTVSDGLARAVGPDEKPDARKRKRKR
jgi:polyphosphate:AMP phosphotransferase